MTSLLPDLYLTRWHHCYLTCTWQDDITVTWPVPDKMTSLLPDLYLTRWHHCYLTCTWQDDITVTWPVPDKMTSLLPDLYLTRWHHRYPTCIWQDDITVTWPVPGKMTSLLPDLYLARWHLCYLTCIWQDDITVTWPVPDKMTSLLLDLYLARWHLCYLTCTWQDDITVTWPVSGKMTSLLPGLYPRVTRLLCCYAAKDRRSGQCDWSTCGVHTEIPKGSMDVRFQVNSDVCSLVLCACIHATRQLPDGERGGREGKEDQRESPHGRHERLRLLVSKRTPSYIDDSCLLILNTSHIPVWCNLIYQLTTVVLLPLWNCSHLTSKVALRQSRIIFVVIVCMRWAVLI